MLYTSDAIKTRKNKENKFKKNINIIIYIFLLLNKLPAMPVV